MYSSAKGNLHDKIQNRQVNNQHVAWSTKAFTTVKEIVLTVDALIQKRIINKSPSENPNDNAIAGKSAKHENDVEKP